MELEYLASFVMRTDISSTIVPTDTRGDSLWHLLRDHRKTKNSKKKSFAFCKPYMDPSTEESTPSTEEPQTSTETPQPTTVKRERTEAQKEALKKARAKAMTVRAENAALKKREQEIEKQMAEKAKQERLAKIQEYEKEQEEPDEPEPEPVKRKKKPARRVIVTEVSSGEETEEDVEVVLPKAKKSAQQLQYERTVQKMFSLS
jgi:hypothetical protein